MANYAVDREKWAQLTFCQQMGNIGSEVGRAINSWRNGKTARCDGAIARALDLFSATVELLTAQHSYRAKEVLRARDQFLALFYDGTFDADADAIEHYFSCFAIAAQKGF